MMNIYQKCLNEWGKDRQVIQTVEEMAELTKELIKNINRGASNSQEIIEEIADVEIMLEQMKICYNISEEVENYKQNKLISIEERFFK